MDPEHCWKPLYITLSYQAAVNAGLPHTVPAMGINMVCGSGLRAVALSAQVFFFFFQVFSLSR
jgi:hypothetical protein